jgi:hypothetical protein
METKIPQTKQEVYTHTRARFLFDSLISIFTVLKFGGFGFFV